MLGTSTSQHQRQREEGPTGPPLPPRSHLPEQYIGSLVWEAYSQATQGSYAKEKNSQNVSDERGLIERIWPRG